MFEWITAILMGAIITGIVWFLIKFGRKED
jgi:hypothetical protein